MSNDQCPMSKYLSLDHFCHFKLYLTFNFSGLSGLGISAHPEDNLLSMFGISDIRISDLFRVSVFGFRIYPAFRKAQEMAEPVDCF